MGIVIRLNSCYNALLRAVTPNFYIGDEVKWRRGKHMKHVQLFGIVLIVLALFATPVHAELPEPGMTPDHPLYFMDRFFDRFQSADAVADERAAEMLAMARENNARGLERAQRAYERAMEKREAEAEDDENLAEDFARQSSMHAAELARVRETTEAVDALDQAIDFSANARERAIGRLERANPERAGIVAQETLEELLAELPDSALNGIRQALERVEERRGRTLGDYVTSEEIRATVTELYPEDPIVELEREREEGKLIYSVELASGLELEFNARNGELLEEEMDTPFSATLTLEEAQAIAQSYFPEAELLSAETDTDSGVSYYEFEFSGDNEIAIDANTGEVLDLEVSVENVPVTLADAEAIALGLYPEAEILEIEFEDDGYYAVELSNDVELEIDAFTGELLVEEVDFLEADAAVSREEAQAIALDLYPDAEVVEVDFDDDGYYEIELSNDIELEIDAMTGAVLSTDMDDDLDDDMDDDLDDDFDEEDSEDDSDDDDADDDSDDDSDDDDSDDDDSDDDDE